MAVEGAFENFLKGKPTLHELCEHVRVDSIWYELGVVLKLDITKLEDISKLNKTLDVKAAKMFELWLNSSGNATRREIIEALRKPDIGENLAADKYVQALKQSLECITQIIQKYSQLVIPMCVIQTLYTEGVISKETFDEMERSGGQLTAGPLRALSDTVSEDPNMLRVFGSVLLHSEDTVQVGQDILREYDSTFPPELKVESDATAQTTGATANSSVAGLYLQPTYQNKFDIMRAKFEKFIYTVGCLIESAVASKLNEFKKFLQTSFPELKPQLSTAKLFYDIISIVRKKCTIINVTYFEAIVDHYDIAKAKGHVLKFCSSIDEFCEKTNLSVCKNENFMTSSSTLLKCETIQFVLEWKNDRYTLGAIRELLWKVFGSMSTRVLVKEIKEENPTTMIVTCYAPQHIMDLLQHNAEEIVLFLGCFGVVKLTMGYHVVWEAHEEESGYEGGLAEGRDVDIWETLTLNHMIQTLTLNTGREKDKESTSKSSQLKERDEHIICSKESPKGPK